MDDPDKLAQSFVAVWNERDPVRRREAVHRLWSEDGRHVMGSQDVRGHDALDERVTASHKRSVVDQDYIFRPATKIDSLPGMIKFRWDLARQESGEVVSAGVGFLSLAADGRIACDWLFVEA